MIDDIPKHSRNYDWNVGSIMQHFDADLVVNALKHVGDTKPLINSIGLAWVLGEFRSRDIFVKNFLNQVIIESTDSDAWWLAAKSLEQIYNESAIANLKRSLKEAGLDSIEQNVNILYDKRSLILFLKRIDEDFAPQQILSDLKRIICKTDDYNLLHNAIWILGRLKIMDKAVFKHLLRLIHSTKDYSLKHVATSAIFEHRGNDIFDFAKSQINSSDQLIRRLAIRYLGKNGEINSVQVCEQALAKEKDTLIINELVSSIYQIFKSIRDSAPNQNYFENGYFSRIGVDTKNHLILHNLDEFWSCLDPENVCFNLICQKLRGKRIIDPVDLGTGTGRLLWQIIDKLKFDGTLYGVDVSPSMIEFADRKMRRERKYTHGIRFVNCAISDLPKKEHIRSSLVISSFGFPSCAADPARCLAELKAVRDILSDDGLLVTIGWDETFNDDLSQMWFRYIPDDIVARDFEEWRAKRSAQFETPRNCGLTWFKRGLVVPLQFGSLREAATVMGGLFGRDAAESVVRQNRTEWSISVGITMDSKRDIERTIRSYEKRS